MSEWVKIKVQSIINNNSTSIDLPKDSFGGEILVPHPSGDQVFFTNSYSSYDFASNTYHHFNVQIIERQSNSSFDGLVASGAVILPSLTNTILEPNLVGGSPLYDGPSLFQQYFVDPTSLESFTTYNSAGNPYTEYFYGTAWMRDASSFYPFTSGADEVDFNNLTSDQLNEFVNYTSTLGVNYYGPYPTLYGFGGNDNITLPSLKDKMQVIAGDGKIIDWSKIARYTYYTGSNEGDNDFVYGLDANYVINLGAGTDTVNISGNGNNTITGGSGKAVVVLGGNGTDEFRLGTYASGSNAQSSNALTLGTGGTTKIDFTTATQSVTIYNEANFTKNGGKLVISGFVQGDAIDFVGVGPLTTSAVYDSEGNKVSGQLNVYNLKTLFATLTFDATVDTSSLEPLLDGNQGTKIVIDPTPVGPEDPTGSKIDWQTIHLNESIGGVSVLTPYVPNGANPKDKSGVTIAQGVDLGKNGNANLNLSTALKVDATQNPNLVFLTNAIGKDHAGSIAAAKSGQSISVSGNPYASSVSITKEQANALTYYTENKIYTKLVADYNKAAGDNGGWSTLSAGQQTAIFDIAYNIGPSKLESISSLWSLLISHQWAKASSRIFLPGDLFEDGVSEGIGQTNQRRAQNAALILDGTDLLPSAFITGSSSGDVASYSADVAAGQELAFDPPGPTLTFAEGVGSPSIASITLPDTDASAYKVSAEINGVWTTPAIYQPEATATFGTDGATALRVEMLDANGNLLTTASDFTFYLSFNGAGHINATVVSQPPVSAVPYLNVSYTQVNTIVGTATPGATVALFDDTGTGTSEPIGNVAADPQTGAFSFTGILLPAGLNNLTVAVENLDGSFGPSSNSVLVAAGTAADIVSQLDSLNALSGLLGIEVTDTNVLPFASLAAVQHAISFDGTALAKISGGYSFSVETDYEDDTLTTYYDAQGRPYQTIDYNAVALSEIITRFDVNGNELSQTTYQNNHREEASFYVPSGDTKQDAIYDLDNNLISMSRYYADGKQSFEQDVAPDKSQQVTYFSESGAVRETIIIGTDKSREVDTYDPTGKTVVSSVITQGDGSRLFRYFDATGHETAYTTYNTDGSRTFANLDITGKPYTEQAATYDSSGHLLAMTRNYGDAAHTLAFSLVNKPDGETDVSHFDTAGRQVLLNVTTPDHERDQYTSTYAGTSTTPSSVEHDHFNALNVRDSTTTNFVFQPHSGQEVITAFHAGAGPNHDTIQFDSAVVPDFAHLQSLFSPVGHDTLISISPTDTLLVKGRAPTALVAQDFTFVHAGSGV